MLKKQGEIVKGNSNDIMKFISATGAHLNATLDMFAKEYLPTSSNILKDSKDVFADVKKFVKETPSGLLSTVKSTCRLSVFKDIFNWYTDTSAKYDTNINSIGDTELNFDSGVNLDIPDVSDDDSSKDSTKSTLTEMSKNSDKVASTVLESSRKLAEVQVASLSAMTNLMEKTNSLIASGFEKVNASIKELTSIVTKNTATLIQVASIGKEVKNNNSSSKSSDDDDKLFDYNYLINEGFSLKKYADYVKRNMNRNGLGLVSAGLGMLQQNLTQAGPAGLLKNGLDLLAARFAPEIKKSLKGVDEGIQSFIKTTLIDLGRGKLFGKKIDLDMGFFNLTDLLKAFGVRPDSFYAQRISRSSFEHKAISFDTETKESIVKVIPGYLREISKALTGVEKFYNIDTRSWQTKQQAIDFIQREKNNANSGISFGSMFNKLGMNNLSNIKPDDRSDEMVNFIIDEILNSLMIEISNGQDIQDYLTRFNTVDKVKKYLMDRVFNDDNSTPEIQAKVKEFLSNEKNISKIDLIVLFIHQLKLNRDVQDDFRKNTQRSFERRTKTAEKLSKTFKNQELIDVFSEADDSGNKGLQEYRFKNMKIKLAKERQQEEINKLEKEINELKKKREHLFDENRTTYAKEQEKKEEILKQKQNDLSTYEERVRRGEISPDGINQLINSNSNTSITKNTRKGKKYSASRGGYGGPDEDLINSLEELDLDGLIKDHNIKDSIDQKNPSNRSENINIITNTYSRKGHYLSPLGRYKYKISSFFGPRMLRGKPNNHTGIDLSAPGGTEITAPSDGEIVENLPSSRSNGYGNFLAYLDKSGKMFFGFGHMSKPSTLRIGSRIKQGDTLGYVGSTGNAYGNHLHFEVLRRLNSNKNYWGSYTDGSFINPMGILNDQYGVDESSEQDVGGPQGSSADTLLAILRSPGHVTKEIVENKLNEAASKFIDKTLLKAKKSIEESTFGKEMNSIGSRIKAGFFGGTYTEVKDGKQITMKVQDEGIMGLLWKNIIKYFGDMNEEEKKTKEKMGKISKIIGKGATNFIFGKKANAIDRILTASIGGMGGGMIGGPFGLLVGSILGATVPVADLGDKINTFIFGDLFKKNADPNKPKMGFLEKTLFDFLVPFKLEFKKTKDYFIAHFKRSVIGEYKAIKAAIKAFLKSKLVDGIWKKFINLPLVKGIWTVLKSPFTITGWIIKKLWGLFTGATGLLGKGLWGLITGGIPGLIGNTARAGINMASTGIRTASRTVGYPFGLMNIFSPSVIAAYQHELNQANNQFNQDIGKVGYNLGDALLEAGSFNFGYGWEMAKSLGTKDKNGKWNPKSALSKINIPVFGPTQDWDYKDQEKEKWFNARNSLRSVFFGHEIKGKDTPFDTTAKKTEEVAKNTKNIAERTEAILNELTGKNNQSPSKSRNKSTNEIKSKPIKNKSNSKPKQQSQSKKSTQSNSNQSNTNTPALGIVPQGMDMDDPMFNWIEDKFMGAYKFLFKGNDWLDIIPEDENIPTITGSPSEQISKLTAKEKRERKAQRKELAKNYKSKSKALTFGSFAEIEKSIFEQNSTKSEKINQLNNLANQVSGEDREDANKAIDMARKSLSNQNKKSVLDKIGDFLSKVGGKFKGFNWLQLIWDGFVTLPFIGIAIGGIHHLIKKFLPAIHNNQQINDKIKPDDINTNIDADINKISLRLGGQAFSTASNYRNIMNASKIDFLSVDKTAQESLLNKTNIRDASKAFLINDAEANKATATKAQLTNKKSLNEWAKEANERFIKSAGRADINKAFRGSSTEGLEIYANKTQAEILEKLATRNFAQDASKEFSEIEIKEMVAEAVKDKISSKYNKIAIFLPVIITLGLTHNTVKGIIIYLMDLFFPNMSKIEKIKWISRVLIIADLGVVMVTVGFLKIILKHIVPFLRKVIKHGILKTIENTADKSAIKEANKTSTKIINSIAKDEVQGLAKIEQALIKKNSKATNGVVKFFNNLIARISKASVRTAADTASAGVTIVIGATMGSIYGAIDANNAFELVEGVKIPSNLYNDMVQLSTAYNAITFALDWLLVAELIFDFSVEFLQSFGMLNNIEIDGVKLPKNLKTIRGFILWSLLITKNSKKSNPNILLKVLNVMNPVVTPFNSEYDKISPFFKNYNKSQDSLNTLTKNIETRKNKLKEISKKMNLTPNEEKNMSDSSILTTIGGRFNPKNPILTTNSIYGQYRIPFMINGAKSLGKDDEGIIYKPGTESLGETEEERLSQMYILKDEDGNNKIINPLWHAFVSQLAKGPAGELSKEDFTSNLYNDKVLGSISNNDIEIVTDPKTGKKFRRIKIPRMFMNPFFDDINNEKVKGYQAFSEYNNNLNKYIIGLFGETGFGDGKGPMKSLYPNLYAKLSKKPVKDLIKEAYKQYEKHPEYYKSLMVKKGENYLLEPFLDYLRKEAKKIDIDEYNRLINEKALLPEQHPLVKQYQDIIRINFNKKINAQNISKDGQGGQADYNPTARINAAKKSTAINSINQEKKQQNGTPTYASPLGNSVLNLTSPFGPRWGGSDFHTGVDFGADPGTDITAPSDGVVVDNAPEAVSAGYGNFLAYLDKSGKMFFGFGHMNRPSSLHIGEEIKQGQKIGEVGFTGHCVPKGPAGSHLHFEVVKRLNSSTDYWQNWGGKKNPSTFYNPEMILKNIDPNAKYDLSYDNKGDGSVSNEELSKPNSLKDYADQTNKRMSGFEKVFYNSSVGKLFTIFDDLFGGFTKGFGLSNATGSSSGANSAGISSYGTGSFNAAEGKSNRDKLYMLLRNNGFSPQAAIGVLANIQAESSFNTEAISSDGHHSVGICQWTNDRETNLYNFAKKHGKSPNDLELQFNYFMHEFSQYPSLMNLKNTNDAGLMAETMCIDFERPADKYYRAQERRQMAVELTKPLMNLESKSTGNKKPGGGPSDVQAANLLRSIQIYKNIGKNRNKKTPYISIPQVRRKLNNIHIPTPAELFQLQLDSPSQTEYNFNTNQSNKSIEEKLDIMISLLTQLIQTSKEGNGIANGLPNVISGILNLDKQKLSDEIQKVNNKHYVPNRYVNKNNVHGIPQIIVG